MAEKRRVLDSLDLLPDDCQDDVVWAVGELNQRKRTAADILFEFNDRLAVKGAGPISRQAFSRRSVRLKRRADQLHEKNAMYAGLAKNLKPESVSESDLVLGEFLKVLLDELLDGEALDSKNAMELARAYKDTIMAQRHSAELKERLETLAKEKLQKAASDVAQIARKAGVSQETMDEINRRLGAI